jgi:hypothetical protein
MKLHTEGRKNHPQPLQQLLEGSHDPTPLHVSCLHDFLDGPGVALSRSTPISGRYDPSC